MDQQIVEATNSSFQPVYVRALKTWHTLAGLVILIIWSEARYTNTLTHYLSYAAPFFGPAFLATALYVHFFPSKAQRGAAFGFLFFAGYFTTAYLFAFIVGPWEYSYLIFSNAVWATSIYLYANLFLGKLAYRASMFNAVVTTALTLACIARYVKSGFPAQSEQYGIQPYVYSLVAQWAMLKGAQVINELYRAVRSSERQVVFLKQVVAEMVGHEIGTPMQSIVNNLELLQLLVKRMPNTDDSATLVHKTDKAIGNLRRSVEQIERVLSNAAASSKSEAKVDAGQPANDEVDLPHLLDSIIEDFKAKANAQDVTLRYEKGYPLPKRVVIDKTRITQIVTNLLSNAIKYTDAGEVVLRVVSLKKDELQISVSDTGIGIPKHAVDEIFEPYVRLPDALRRSTPGSGLGLAVVKRELAVLNGSIRVESIHGKGSIFTVTVFAKVANFVVYKNKAKPDVLVVDDSDEVTCAAKELLSDSGFECTTASNGGEAMNLLAGHQFDLVFLDIQMPIANGYEVARSIRTNEALKINAAVPIIGMSATEPTDQRGVAETFNFFLRKPFALTPTLVGSYLSTHQITEGHDHDSTGDASLCTSQVQLSF